MADNKNEIAFDDFAMTAELEAAVAAEELRMLSQPAAAPAPSPPFLSPAVFLLPSLEAHRDAMMSDADLELLYNKLSPDQRRAVDMFSLDTTDLPRSCFITGPPGTGKSVVIAVLLNKLIRKMAAMLMQKHQRFGGTLSGLMESSRHLVAVTASTGRAADNIGGCTLHSYLGLTGKTLEKAKELAKKINDRKPNIAKRLMRTAYLFIDEVSMISADLFTMADWVTRYLVQDTTRPFGGICVIAVGDFLQLEPVKASEEGGFAFQSSSWRQSIGNNIVYLRTVFRQKCPLLSGIIASVRQARLSPENEKLLLSRRVKTPAADAVFIYPMNFQVRRRNLELLSSLPDPTLIYYQAATWGDTPEQLDALLRDLLVKRHLQLRIGAPVILLRNTAEEKNGTLGRVVEWAKVPVKAWKEYQQKKGSASSKQQHEDTAQLIESWLEPFKARYPDLEAIDFYLPPSAGPPQLGCIPMRVCSPPANQLVPLLPAKYLIDKVQELNNGSQLCYTARAVFKDLCSRQYKPWNKRGPSSSVAAAAAESGRAPDDSTVAKPEEAGPPVDHKVSYYYFPIIEFEPPALLASNTDSGIAKRHKLVLPCMFQREVPTVMRGAGGTIATVWKVVAYFYQLPLAMAGAITVHKSQGMTFPRANIDLGKRVFGINMCYVAISRVTTLAGLHLLNYDRDALLNMNKVLIEFYQELEKRHQQEPPASAGVQQTAGQKRTNEAATNGTKRIAPMERR